MTDHPLILIHQPFCQGSNLYSLSPTRDSVVGYSSPPRSEQKILYHHLCSLHPITRHFAKEVGLILGIQHLLYGSRKQKATPIRHVVSSVEEVAISALERLAEAIEDEEEPLVIQQGEKYIVVILR